VSIALADVVKLLESAFALSAKWRFINCGEIAPVLNAVDVPYYLLVKVDDPINTTTIAAAAQSTQLSLCKVHYVYAAGLLFAYLIEVPNFHVTVKTNMVTIMRQSVAQEHQFTEVKMVMQNNHLSIFHSGDGACLVTFTERFANLNQDILKGSNG
jgi:uncharacterized membrane protein YciS (DUF1049 family)